MAWDITIGSVAGGGSAAISAVLIVVAWRHRKEWMALPFMGLAVSLSAWSLSYGVQLGFDTIGEQLLWQRLTLGVSGFVPTLWLLFVFGFTGRQNWLERRRLLLLIAEPIVFLSLCLTNPLHGFVWSEGVMTVTGVGDVPALQFGPGYGVHIIYAYIAVAAGIGILLIYGTQVAPVYQKQVVLLIIAAVPPLLSHVSFTIGQSPIPNLDLTPFVFVFTGSTLGLALYRFDLLKLAPVARSQAFNDVGDGLIVINEFEEIVDSFGVASAVLDPTPLVGKPISTVFPDSSLAELDGTELATRFDGQRRVYQFQVSPLTAPPDRQVGAMLILRDITGLRESKQRLSVSNRVLRHNLRNDMTVVLGYAERLESRLDGQDADDARKIRETVKGILDLAEKARQITKLREGSEDRRTTIDIDKLLTEEVADLESTYPNAEFRRNGTVAAQVDVIDAETFQLALRNLLDNAVRHNDAAEPIVEIAVRPAEGMLRVEIADNGPGIPDIEKRAIGSGLETKLEHGQGLGLWLAYWCVTMSGGELFLDSGGDGTTATIAIPTELTDMGQLPV